MSESHLSGAGTRYLGSLDIPHNTQEFTRLSEIC